MLPIWLIAVLAFGLAIFVARKVPKVGEMLVTGGIFLLIEAYHFYLEPTLSWLPAMPPWFLLFVGVYIGTSALFIILKFIPQTKAIAMVIAGD